MLNSLFPPAHNESQGKPTFRLWPKTLERRSSLLSPSHSLHETNSEGQVIRILPLLAKNKTRLRSRTSHVSFRLAQCHFRHILIRVALSASASTRSEARSLLPVLHNWKQHSTIFQLRHDPRRNAPLYATNAGRGLPSPILRQFFRQFAVALVPVRPTSTT